MAEHSIVDDNHDKFNERENHSNVCQSLDPLCSTMLENTDERILVQEMSQLSTNKIINKNVCFINNIQNDINKTPCWLTKRNKSFQQIIDQIVDIMPIKTSTEQRNELRLIAILIYKIKIIPMYHRLWTSYFKLSAEQLIEEPKRQDIYQIHLKFWPKEVTTILQSTIVDERNKDQLCRKIVHDHLHYLDDQLKQNQIEWNRKINSFNGYTLQIEELFENYIEQNLVSLSMEIEHKIELVHYDYHIQALKVEYHRHNPNEYQKRLLKQFCCHKYEQETTEQEFHFLQQQMAYYNASDQSFENSIIAQSTVIGSIKNSELRRELFNRYRDIAVQSRAFLFNFYLKTIDEQRKECKKKYDIEVEKMWSDRCALGNDEQISMIMIDLINERCKKISERIQCIYRYKSQSLQLKSKQ